ncbi:hypothetical protein ES705_14130 [subsurface metagenome]
MRYCHNCGGEFKIEFVSTYPYKKYQEISDKYYDNENEEYMDLFNQIRKDGIKGVSIRYHEETHCWYICKVISHEDWTKRYKEFMSHKELNEENKRKFREKLKKYFLRIFVCSKCGFSTPDQYWEDEERIRTTSFHSLRR